MRLSLRSQLPALITLSLLASLPLQASASEKLFVDSGCAKCHAVSAYGIKKATIDEEEGEDGKAGPPDLSDLGKYADAAYLTAYLKKEAPVKNRDGSTGTAKHKIKFKGSDADLTALAGWLATLKKDPVK